MNNQQKQLYQQLAQDHHVKQALSRSPEAEVACKMCGEKIMFDGVTDRLIKCSACESKLIVKKNEDGYFTKWL